MKRRLTLAVLLALSICTLPASAEADLSNIRFGDHVTGPQGITKNDFAGRIVIVEYWGVNCPPCLAQIPHISKLAKDYGHDRLIVLASHRQSASIEKIKETWESRAKGQYVIVQQQATVPGFEVRGIPAAIMFDQKGREIWRGHPGQIEKPLKAAMKNFRVVRKPKEAEPVKDPIVTGVEAKYFKRELAQINDQKRKIDSSLRGIRAKVQRSKREDQIAEGQAILDAVADWARAQLSLAQSVKKNDPAEAYAIADKAIALLASDALSQPLAAMKQTMESDDALMDVVRSTNMLREVKALAQEIGLAGEKPAEFNAKKHARDLSKIDRDLRRIAKAWPQTAAGKEAQSLLNTWNLQ